MLKHRGNGRISSSRPTATTFSLCSHALSSAGLGAWFWFDGFSTSLDFSFGLTFSSLSRSHDESSVDNLKHREHTHTQRVYSNRRKNGEWFIILFDKGEHNSKNTSYGYFGRFKSNV
jgi:hypothetical protein